MLRKLLSTLAVLLLATPALGAPSKAKTRAAPRLVEGHIQQPLLLSLPMLGAVRWRVASGGQAHCTVRSIHGLEAKGEIDKRLSFLRKQLSRPPFSSYKTMKLLEAKDLQIPMAGVKGTTLPTGKKLRLTFKEKLLGRKDAIRLRMHLQIGSPEKKKIDTIFVIANKGTLLVAGDKHKGGTLVVAITCEAK